MRRAAPLPLLTLLSFLHFASPLPAQTPAERFHAAEARWSAHRPDGSVLDDGSQAARDALAAMWSAVADLALATLNAKPAITADELSKSLTALEPKPDPKFGPQLSASAVKLAPATFALAFNDDAAGTVLILGPQGSTASSTKAGVLWQIDSMAAQPVDHADLLHAWQLARQGEACRQAHHGANRDGSCGPLTASLNSLPPDGAKHPRFLLDATYSQDMGATFGKQASIWAWDGSAPHLLWINLYTINADQRFGMSYNDGTLEIGEKGQFRSFFACGSCDGRQLVHTLRLTDAGVDDLGTRSTVPELDALDTLFSLLGSQASAAQAAPGLTPEALASPEALATLKPLLGEAKSESAKVGSDYFSLGMLESSSVHKRGGVSEVCLTLDRTGRLNAVLEQRANQAYVSSLSQDPAKDASCK